MSLSLISASLIVILFGSPMLVTALIVGLLDRCQKVAFGTAGASCLMPSMESTKALPKRFGFSRDCATSPEALKARLVFGTLMLVSELSASSTSKLDGVERTSGITVGLGAKV